MDIPLSAWSLELEYLTYKTLHLIFIVAWFAGLFYLPRLFVYHSMCEDRPGIERFKIMERKLFWGIATPSAILTIIFGLLLWLRIGFGGGWLHAKLTLVLLMVLYHIWCGKLLNDFKHERNRHGHVWYRWFNEMPIFALAGIIYLVVFKPF